VDRDDAYCNRATMGATATTVSARCNTEQDLPLTGACEKFGNIDAVLDLNEAWKWDVTTEKAGWRCGWSLDGSGALVHIEGAQAIICCVTHP
jgi:hypothetical protein